MKKTKTIFKTAISSLLSKQGTDEVLSEAALPAYAHQNPIIDYIFWKRLAIASDFIKSTAVPNSKILDFGCGTGVFSYEMAIQNHSVFALDLDLTPVSLLGTMLDFPKSISFNQGEFLSMDFGDMKFDYIVALDVLEHIPIELLPKYIDKFNTLLNEKGFILISGPTENVLYKIGRKFAGSDFTGEYHETTISRIKDVFSTQFEINVLRRLIWPLTLFEVFTAKKSL